uniref:Rif1_N domain-containing protein n=1 Tax=Globodera pallida TaxID=36090 RepID=A0A183CT84_GLOPA
MLHMQMDELGGNSSKKEGEKFETPQDIMFNYGCLANLLVKVLKKHRSDSPTQRIMVFLLNSMVCHAEVGKKIEVGEIGAIEVILQQIARKLQANQCDNVINTAWSFLFSITDETPANCDRFLKAEGLTLFLRCYTKFSTQVELMRNMMGLIGNIAEVDELRGQLMHDDYLKIFW